MNKTDRKRTKGKPHISLRRPAEKYKSVNVLVKDDYIECPKDKESFYKEDGLYLECRFCGKRIIRHE